MGAQFSKIRSTILHFLEIFGNAKKTCFHLPLFFSFFTIFVGFLKASGLFLASFWSLCRLFGFLVSSFWVPLARLGCLWALSATFCGAFGSSRLSVGSGIAPGLFIFETCSMCFRLFFHLLAWSRPRRRCGRRPLQ